MQPTRLLHPWHFPGKSTGVGCHCLLRLDVTKTPFWKPSPTTCPLWPGGLTWARFGAHVHLLHVRIRWLFRWILRSDPGLDGCVSFSFLQLTRHCEIEERFSLNTLSSKGTRAWDHPAWPKVVVGSGVAEGVISARTISQMLVWQPGYDFIRKVCAVKAFFIFKIKANFTFILVSWGRTDPHLGHVSFISQLFQGVSLFPSLHLSGINSPDI